MWIYVDLCGFMWICQWSEGEVRLPLSRRVNFKTALKKRNLLQVPKIIRCKFKMETNEVLKVTVNVAGLFANTEIFWAKMGKDGRIEVPNLLLALLKHDEPSLEGSVMEVTLEPA
jgi:hypothetical protein